MGVTSILVAGIGGVGGYFGGKLAKYFQDRPDGQVYFLARGKHLGTIQKSGLRVVEGQNEFVVHPQIAADNVQNMGKVHYVLVCTKSHDLEETVRQILPCINNQTVILPLLNGVDSVARISKLLPNNLICDGCVYIISRLSEPGKVENLGNIQKLFFGVQGYSDVKLELLADLFAKAEIETVLSKNIKTIIWEKFVFISAMATATSYFNERVGPIVADESKRNTVKQLVQECTVIATLKGIAITEGMPELVMDKLKTLPADATSSLHSDFQNRKTRTELQSLITYVVLEGQKLKAVTPIYEKLLSGIEDTWNLKEN